MRGVWSRQEGHDGVSGVGRRAMMGCLGQASCLIKKKDVLQYPLCK